MMDANRIFVTLLEKRAAGAMLHACGFAILLSFVSYSSFTFADANAAANKTRDGIAEFEKRDFKAALKAFGEAESIAPDDLRLAFDRGCALAAQGEFDKATEQFQKSAAAADKKLAALSNYNLGCVATARAKSKFGEKPENAEGDVRTQGLEMIETAGRHFREALNIDSQNEEARYNLETLRSWKKYIEKTWKDRDRQARREKLNLLDYLQMLETEQRALRTKVKELQSIAQDSPRKRQSIREVENTERDLAEEIGTLKQKIDQLAAGQGRGAGAEASLPADTQKAVELLKTLADQIGKSMQVAADRLAETALSDSIEPQNNAIDNLDEIFMAVAPYANLVQRGIAREEELIGLSDKKISENALSEKATSEKNAESKPDFAEAAWNQRFVARYGKIIPFKAKQELKQLESQATTPAASATESSGITADGKNSPKEDAKKEAALKAEEQRREMKEALQMGVELAPKVEQLAQEAADLLSGEKSAEALPKQQECLKLLKEMLPKQQQQEQQQKEQKKKEQDKKDQQQKDQQKKDQQNDQQKKNQDKKDQQKKDQEKKDSQKKDQEKKDRQEQESPKKDQSKPQSGETSPQKQEMSEEQAEAMLRRMRQRQEEHKEMQKEIEGYLYRPEKVEKDW